MTLDANGIYNYDEDDDQLSPFSDLLNLGMESVSDEIANDRGRLDALEGRGNASSWTPAFTNATVGNGAVTAYWARIGDLVAWQWKWVLGTTSAITNTFNADLPTEVAGATWMVVGNGFVSRGTSATGKTLGLCRMSGPTVWQFWYPGAASLNATSPLAGGTWTTGDVISVGGTYFAV